MKKFLSLVLALAMTLSLVTISAGAKDFADSDELSGERYEEAVNVMSEMGIIDGYASGDFQPQGTLTRGAAAKIIACMMLGKTTAEALGTQAAPFKDVPAGSTFAGYIAYCVESGLIDGYADGTFRPGNTLTGFAFLKMLLTALGYDSSIEGYTGTNWTVNVASRATQIGLTDGNDDFVGTRAATREEACLYAVNALQATLVEYENKGQEIVVSDGTVITVRPSAPTFVTSNIAGAATSIDDTRTTPPTTTPWSSPRSISPTWSWTRPTCSAAPLTPGAGRATRSAPMWTTTSWSPSTPPSHRPTICMTCSAVPPLTSTVRVYVDGESDLCWETPKNNQGQTCPRPATASDPGVPRHPRRVPWLSSTPTWPRLPRTTTRRTKRLSSRLHDQGRRQEPLCQVQLLQQEH